MCPSFLFDSGCYVEVWIAFEGLDTGTIHVQVNDFPMRFGIEIHPAQLPEVHPSTAFLRRFRPIFTAEPINGQTRGWASPKTERRRKNPE